MIRTPVIIALALLSALAGCGTAPPGPFIAVSQAGYDSGQSKWALLVNESAESFTLRDAESREILWFGPVSGTREPDAATGDTTSVLDFSPFSVPGEYILQAGESGPVSPPFRIGEDPLREPLRIAIQSFYFNRCGTAVDNGQPWKHPVCHPDDARYYADTARHREVHGGWHDAGDHGKFSVNTALTVGLMLSLYEQRTELFGDGQLNIPESDNGVPDLLDEVRWALEWMLRMQGEEGGIHHKVSQKRWIGEFLPHKDPSERYLFRISSTSTGGFAAVAAMGSRVYEPWDPTFAERLARAARRAWSFLEAHPDIVPEGGFTNPEDVHGGGYGDESDRDERSWAAIELYRLTGEERFLSAFDSHYSRSSPPPPLSWKNVHSLAGGSYINASLPPAYRQRQKQVTAHLSAEAERLAGMWEKNNYRSLLRENEYYWGSASVNLGHAFLLIQLHRKTGGGRWYRAAIDQVHYTLGRNPNNRSYLTGIGSRPVHHPYHQFSMELDHDLPVPGMMVGGPNNRIHLDGEEVSRHPAKSYADEEHNYLDNEVAINFTGIFIYTAGYFASQDEVLSSKSR